MTCMNLRGLVMASKISLAIPAFSISRRETQFEESQKRSYVSLTTRSPASALTLDVRKVNAPVRLAKRKNRSLNTDKEEDDDSEILQNAETEAEEPVWNDKQGSIISAVTAGESVFITGSAGTGKTVLLKHLIMLLKKRHKWRDVFVTAPTGVAACALNCQTLHSFAGLRPMTDDPVKEAMTNDKACERWKSAGALVIDEISMVGCELFDTLENMAREIRRKDSVWGGIQLVVSGDFLQLPPIPKDKDDGDPPPPPPDKEFAFEADCWGSSFSLHVELERVYRQSDSELIEMLQSVRRGKKDHAALKILEHSCSKSRPDPSVIELYPMKKEVKRVNEARLKSLNREPRIFRAVEKGPSQRWLRQIRQGTPPDEVAICEGARVMLVKNIDTQHRLVNGATGTVVGFDDDEFPHVCFDYQKRFMVIKPESWTAEEKKKVVARRTQIPLILAWAATVPKCQGMTLDRLRTDLSRAFGYGMVYVALSRVRSLDGVHLSGFSPQTIKAHPKVVQFYNDLAAGKVPHHRQ